MEPRNRKDSKDTYPTYKLDGLPLFSSRGASTDSLGIEMHELGDIPMEALAMLQEDNPQAGDWLGVGGGHSPVSTSQQHGARSKTSEVDRQSYERSRGLSRFIPRSMQGLQQGPLPLPGGGQPFLSHGFSQGLLQQGELTHPSLRDHHRQLQLLQGSLPLPGMLDEGMGQGSATSAAGYRNAFAQRHNAGRFAESARGGQPSQPRQSAESLSETQSESKLAADQSSGAATHELQQRAPPQQPAAKDDYPGSTGEDGSALDGVSRNDSSDASITTFWDSARGVSRRTSSDTFTGSWRHDDMERAQEGMAHGASRSTSPTQVRCASQPAPLRANGRRSPFNRPCPTPSNRPCPTPFNRPCPTPSNRPCPTPFNRPRLIPFHRPCLTPLHIAAGRRKEFRIG